MHLNPYGAEAVGFGVDLVNEPPRTLDELEKRCRDAGVVVDAPVEADDLADALDLADRFAAIVDAEPGPARAALLNVLLDAATGHPRLTDHDGHWHLHFRDDGLRVGAVLRAIVAVGTALHLSGRGMERLGRCARAGCRAVYADTSRTGRQRYCSPGCANRAAVARHRARQA